MTFSQSYSKIRDNWEQKVNGGKIIRSGNISRKLAKMIKIGARDGPKFKSSTKGKVKYFGDFIRWLAGRLKQYPLHTKLKHLIPVTV